MGLIRGGLVGGFDSGPPGFPGDRSEPARGSLGGLLDDFESLSGARPVDAEGLGDRNAVAVPQPFAGPHRM